MSTLTVAVLYGALETRIPRTLSCSWDNDGLMVCPDAGREVKKILIALDATEDVISRAVTEGYDVVLVHHPMVFKGIKSVDGRDTVSRKVIRAVQNGVTVLSYHTRLDTVEGGVNDTLAAKLGLSNITAFGDHDNAEGASMGRVGDLPDPMPLSDFVLFVKEVLGADGIFVGDAGRLVSRVAVLGGGGDGDVSAGRAVGADTYVTGELKYHQLCDMPYEGINLLAAGHYYTEFPVCWALGDMVREICADLGAAIPEITVMPSNRIVLM